MSVLLSADWHFGSGNTWGKTDPETGINTSLRATLGCVDEMLSYAERNKVTGLVFAGDAFHRRNPTDMERLLFFQVFAKFLKQGKDNWAIVIPGTPSHDGQDIHVPTVTSLSLYRAVLKLAGFDSRRFLIASKPCVVEREGVRYFLAVGMGEKTQDESSLADMFRLSRKKAGRQVLVLHGVVSGAKVGPGDFELPGPSLSLDQIHASRFDLVVAGHLHKHQVIQDKVVYPGSLDRVDFGERTEEKGFLVLNTDKWGWSFVPVSGAKKFVLVDLELSKIGRWKPENLSGSIVKVRITGDRQKFKTADLSRLYEEIGKQTPLHVVVECIRTNEVAARESRVGDLNFQEMLREYLSSKEEGAGKDTVKAATEKGVKILAEAAA